MGTFEQWQKAVYLGPKRKSILFLSFPFFLPVFNGISSIIEHVSWEWKLHLIKPIIWELAGVGVSGTGVVILIQSSFYQVILWWPYTWERLRSNPGLTSHTVENLSFTVFPRWLCFCLRSSNRFTSLSVSDTRREGAAWHCASLVLVRSVTEEP